MTNPYPPSSLLIIGGTKAGKTHYGGQLLRRLETKKYPLRIVTAPSDLTPFDEVLGRLAQGRSAPHTPWGFYRESIWPVRRTDDHADSELIWPDYAGEQIEDIVKKRQASEPWVQRVRSSGGWLFFVRLGTTTVPEDILDRPRGLDRMKSGNNPEDAQQNPPQNPIPPGATELPLPKLTLSSQTGLVELLQALLFIKQAGSVAKLRKPPLVVVLSCWDESIKRDSHGNWQKPAEVLTARLPLLSQFIEATWHPENVEILGLSALGRALDDEVSDEEFVDNGPERQGWCVSRDGRQVEDLTLPIIALMDKIRSGR